MTLIYSLSILESIFLRMLLPDLKGLQIYFDIELHCISSLNCFLIYSNSFFLLHMFLVLSTMNLKYRTTLSESKKLNASGLLQRATANHITADKILYDHAIQMVSCLENKFKSTCVHMSKFLFY